MTGVPLCACSFDGKSIRTNTSNTVKLAYDIFLWIIIHRYFNEYYTEKVLKFSFHKSGDFVYILQFLFFFQNCEFISHNDFATFISHNFES